MTDAPGQSIALPTLPNLRELGGWQTADGRRVRPGLLFRSTDLSRLSDADVAGVDKLGITTIFDLRTAAEREAAPDRRIDGAVEVPLDVLAGASMSIPANMGAILADPSTVARATEALGGGKAIHLVAGTYREIITLPSALHAFSQFFDGLLGAHQVPALFHCTTGKDRTGWAAASLLTLLGVPQDAVYREYLLTNSQLVPALKPVFDGFAAAGGDPELLKPVLGVESVYLDTAFDEVRSRFGGIEAYFADGLGIDANGQQRLRELYLV